MQENKIYVGNLSYSVTNDQLAKLFADYGEVKQVTIIEGKGFGFVEMSNASEADKAREALNGTDFNGRALKVDKARPPKSTGPRRDFPRRDRDDRRGRF
ncbi:MAG: RNA-binding protein [Nitrospirae bacterium]|nr:RNA-binding protein [Nitrospirota bacterium]